MQSSFFLAYCVHSINHRVSQLHGAAKITNDSFNIPTTLNGLNGEDNALKVKLVVIWFIWLASRNLSASGASRGSSFFSQGHFSHFLTKDEFVRSSQSLENVSNKRESHLVSLLEILSLLEDANKLRKGKKSTLCKFCKVAQTVITSLSSRLSSLLFPLTHNWLQLCWRFLPV